MGMMLLTAQIAAMALVNLILATGGDERGLSVTIVGYWALVYVYWALRTVKG